MKTRTTRLALSHSEGIFEVEIVDEGTGEYVMVSCGLDRAPLEQHITIDPSEWPFLRDAIDRMFVEIAENESGEKLKELLETPAPWEKPASDNGSPPWQETSSDSGWIPWEGGECPVHHGTLVAVIFRNGDGAEFKWPAGGHRWGHTGMFTDIIAYKVVD